MTKTTKKTAKTSKKSAVKSVKKAGTKKSAVKTAEGQISKLKAALKAAKAAITNQPIAPAIPAYVIGDNAPETIPGTTGSTFYVFASTPAGVAGARQIGEGSFRVRVVPNEGVQLNLSDWPIQPGMDGRSHFSNAVPTSGLPQAVAEATHALLAASV